MFTAVALTAAPHHGKEFVMVSNKQVPISGFVWKWVALPLAAALVVLVLSAPRACAGGIGPMQGPLLDTMYFDENCNDSVTSGPPGSGSTYVPCKMAADPSSSLPNVMIYTLPYTLDYGDVTVDENTSGAVVIGDDVRFTDYCGDISAQQASNSVNCFNQGATLMIFYSVLPVTALADTGLPNNIDSTLLNQPVAYELGGAFTFYNSAWQSTGYMDFIGYSDNSPAPPGQTYSLLTPEPSTLSLLLLVGAALGLPIYRKHSREVFRS
jgi:hypothetical protein